MSNRRPYCRFFAPLLAAVAAAYALTPIAQGATYTWNVPSGNWSVATNWTSPTGTNVPGSSDTAVFGSTEASSSSTTINNTVDINFPGAVSNLTYNSVFPSASSAIYNVTEITNGKTLTVEGALLVGGLNEGSGGYTTYTYFTGAGTLAADGSFTVQNYGSASGANAAAYLNMSGLTNFVYSNANGTMSIGDNPGSLTRLGGNLTLAGGSNYIIASNINVATSTSAQAGPLCTLVFGAGANVVNVGNVTVANNKNSATISFAAPGAGLRLRGVSGADSDRPPITVGNRSVSGGTGTTTGTMLFDGDTVNIKASTLVVGENGGATAGTGGVGVLMFDTGTIDATTLLMANAPSAGNSTSTVMVGSNANLVVGSGGLSLVNQSASGTCSGTLIISNGTVTCNGNLIDGSAVGTGTITFLNPGSKLIMGPGATIGSASNPISAFNLIENSTLELSVPSSASTNVIVNALTWPVNDSQLTIDIAGLPAGLTIGATIPLISYVSISGGTFTAPNLVLPVGVTGTLALNGNLIVLTITGGVGPGTGGQNEVGNPGFEQTPPDVDWTTTGAASLITVGTATYPDVGACADAQTQLVVSHSGTNVASLSGPDLGAPGISSWEETVPATGSSTYAAGAFTYISHEDILAGQNSFYYEVDFLDADSNVLSSYQSYTITNLTCGETTPFPLDTWVYLPVTNILAVGGGVAGNIASGIITAPEGAASVRFSAVFDQQNSADGGSVYFDDVNLGLVTAPVPPTISAVTPDLVTLCTNTNVTCVISSTVSTITNVELIVQTNTLGSSTIVTMTNTLGSPMLSVAGLGTTNVTISYALTPNTIYPSIVVEATDGDGLTVTSAPASLDTLQPTLVIEGSDFNFSSGEFTDTPPDGGLALYLNDVGTQGIDENKAARTSTKAYYRPNDNVVLQPANPNLGTPPSSTEQKFVTAAADGDTTDVELEVGYNSAGDWLDYTRTYGPGGSAPAGVYNVWCYLATDSTGVLSTLSQVTGPATSANQTTVTLGNFGSATFSDTGWNNFVYVPLVDQFGKLKAVALDGVQTLRDTIVGNPNIGFYMLTPALTPVVDQAYPDGSTMFQQTNQFTFTVTPGNGAAISTNGIELLIDGADANSGVTFTQSGNNWVGSYALQPNTAYSAVIVMTNLAGLSSSYSVYFDTFSATNYQWEAEDYDFSTNSPTTGEWIGGLYIDNPVPTADAAGDGGSVIVLATNSYFCYPADITPLNDPSGLGAVAQQGIDVNYAAASGMLSTYRFDTVGTSVAQDSLRAKFIAAQQEFGDPNITDYYLGWFNSNDWVNYTRDWPSNTYYVYGRMAGGAGAYSNTVLSILTSGAGTTNQATNVLGSFSDPNPSGWYAWHWVPLMNTNGALMPVALGGKETLKVTSGGNVNVNFFMLVPAPAMTQFSISATAAGGQINIAVPTVLGHDYTLLYSPGLNQTNWSPVGSTITGDGSVHVVSESAAGGQGYYRVEVQ